MRVGREYCTRTKVCMCENDGDDTCGVRHENDGRKDVTDEKGYVAKEV